MVGHGKGTADGAALGIVRAVDKAGDARLNHGSGAHGARLDGDVEIGAEKAVISCALGGFAESDDFGVRGGVAMRDGAVSSACDDLTFHHDDGADRDFAAFAGSASLGESDAHEFEIELLGGGHGGSE